MATLTLRSAEEEIECWDDDEDLQIDGSEIQAISRNTNQLGSGIPVDSPRRESVCSKVSTRSDLDTVPGVEEERQVLLPNDDEQSTREAIASAVSAGIPIPKNVPSSALLGGTIRRLGGKRSRKVLGDDWGEDLELPSVEKGGLKLKQPSGTEFPDALRHVSGSTSIPHSPEKSGETMSFAARMKLLQPKSPGVLDLKRFRDEDELDAFLGDSGDVPTIKVAKNRSPRKPIPFFPPVVQSNDSAVDPSKDGPADDFENDLEFPDTGEPLKLSIRKELPKTPATQSDDFDEWAEGSLGTRHGGTRRDARSPRSSSIGVMSPSIASSFTVESEDEGLDGLVLPEGPIRFDDMLKKRQQNTCPDANECPSPRKDADLPTAREDFFSGIEIGDGDVFDSAKLTLNRNIKHKHTRSNSPARRTAVTLTFTNKVQPLTSRIPRPLSGSERLAPTLEPVSESGGPLATTRKAHTRLGGHSAHLSTSHLPAPQTPSSRSAVPSTPTRHRELLKKSSMSALRPDSTTTNSKLLKLKRSMPAMRSNQNQPVKGTSGTQRPPSRTESTGRPAIPARPKTPIDRSGSESSLGHARKPPVPFLPAGMSKSQSHHVSTKASRHFRRPDSESSIGSADLPTRSVSRTGRPPRSVPRSPSPRRKDVAPESLAREASAKRTLVQPAKRRNFGDGTELEIFDDLPTSAASEMKFIKAPVGRGAPRSIRSKLGPISHAPADTIAETLAPPAPFSLSKPEQTPRFARDTNASRIAREQRTGTSTGVPMAPLSTNWKPQMPARGGGMNLGSPTAARVKRRNHHTQKKPHLIKPLGDTHNNAKSVKGMHYNPVLYRWEGNENALAPFDAPNAPSTRTSPLAAQAQLHTNPNAKAEGQRPALITNIASATSQSVQVVGGMVFDPQRMCWLKLSHANQKDAVSKPSSLKTDGQDDAAEDSDDPFAGLEDLEDDEPSRPAPAQPRPAATASASSSPDRARAKSALADEWLVGEEFDVGPEFIRRQREEEVRWRKKVEAWTGPERMKLIESETTATGIDGGEGDEWRWAIREVVRGFL